MRRRQTVIPPGSQWRRCPTPSRCRDCGPRRLTPSEALHICERPAIVHDAPHEHFLREPFGRRPVRRDAQCNIFARRSSFLGRLRSSNMARGLVSSCRATARTLARARTRTSYVTNRTSAAEPPAIRPTAGSIANHAATGRLASRNTRWASSTSVAAAVSQPKHPIRKWFAVGVASATAASRS